MPRLTVDVAAAMPDTGWMVVPLPAHISSANAELVRSRLLWAIDGGAAVLVVDLTATLSCDYSGAEALLQAYQHGVAADTEVRLVVSSEAVRRALRLTGLAHLALMFATPAAALADMRRSPGSSGQMREITAAVPRGALGTENSSRPPQADEALLDSAVDSIFHAGLNLHDATGLSGECVAESLESLNNAIRDIREYVVAANSRRRHAGADASQSPGMPDRSARNAERTAALRRQLTVTARALHAASTETAALMTQRRSLAKEPHRIDYATKIKGWRTIADTAQRMAERCEDA